MQLGLKMRTLIAAFAIALLPITAHAQSNSSLSTSRGERTGHHSHKVWKPKHQKEMDDRMIDKPYEDALKGIPDSKKEFDPWKDAR
jgi:hypothetical protein